MMFQVKYIIGGLFVCGTFAYGTHLLQAKKFRNENERFEFTADLRFDPHPKWVAVPWEPELDVGFAKFRKDVQTALDKMALPDKSSFWSKRTRDSYNEWYNDYQNPVKLYRASTYLGTARIADPTFAGSPEYEKMVGTLRVGWSYLNHPPHSYEFVRRGYTFTANGGSRHIYGDLPFRLLKKDPNDRAVVIAMVWHYYEDIAKTKTATFEELMFSSLARVSKLKPWRTGDEFSYATAHWLFGKRHKNAESIKKGLVKVKNAIKMLPQGYSSKEKAYEQAYKEYETDLKRIEGK